MIRWGVSSLATIPRMVTSPRYETSAGTAATTTRLLYDGDELFAEYSAPATGSPVLLRQYGHGSGSDDPVYWIEAGLPGPSRFLHTNHQGSIVAVSQSPGTAFAINAYDEWGVPASANQGRFQYTGQAWIPELGLYYYKARIYSPTLGRFMQTDPIGYEDQVNLYAYVGNDPGNMVDPSGEKTEVNITLTGSSNVGPHTIYIGHLNLRLTPDIQTNLDTKIFSQIDGDGNRYATISAGPKDAARALVGLDTPLIGKVNRSEATAAQTFGVQKPSKFKTEREFHFALINSAKSYKNDVDYDLFPSRGTDQGRNSNSYLSGILLYNGYDITKLGGKTHYELPGVDVPLEIKATAPKLKTGSRIRR